MNQTVISTTYLKNELNLAADIAAGKGTIPILNNVMLRATDDRLTFHVSDLDLTMITQCPARSDSPWSLGASAKKLKEIAALLPDGECSLIADDGALRLTCGRLKYRLPAISADTFPAVPETPAKQIEISAATFRELIKATMCAITQEESRYALHGAKLEADSKKLRLVATDGHRLSYAETVLPVEGGEIDVLIPRGALANFLKLVDGGAETVTLRYNTSHVQFESGSRVLTSRLLTGAFPNYHQVLPDNKLKVIASAKALSAAVRRVALLSDERSRAIKMQFTGKEIELSAQSAEAGDASENVPVESSDITDVTIGFNATYLLEFFKMVEEGNAELLIKDGASQVEFRPVKNDFTLRYIVMPMRL